MRMGMLAPWVTAKARGSKIHQTAIFRVTSCNFEVAKHLTDFKSRDAISLIKNVHTISHLLHHCRRLLGSPCSWRTGHGQSQGSHSYDLPSAGVACHAPSSSGGTSHRPKAHRRGGQGHQGGSTQCLAWRIDQRE